MSFPGFPQQQDQVAVIAANPRNIGGIMLDVTIQETGLDEMAITEHPVEQSAAISDHAFKKPARVTIRAGASDSSPQAGGDPNYSVDIYNQLLALQATADIFTVVTGKRTYDNMLMGSLTQETDKRSENALMITATFQELILVETSTSPTGPAPAQADPASTQSTTNAGTQQLGPAPNFNAPAAAGITGS